MTLSHDETAIFFELVLSLPSKEVRETLFVELSKIGRKEPEFYMGVIEHFSALKYNSEEWSDFLTKIPNRVFRDEIRIMNKLSQSQREKLPPATFESL